MKRTSILIELTTVMQACNPNTQEENSRLTWAQNEFKTILEYIETMEVAGRIYI